MVVTTSKPPVRRAQSHEQSQDRQSSSLKVRSRPFSHMFGSGRNAGQSGTVQPSLRDSRPDFRASESSSQSLPAEVLSASSDVAIIDSDPSDKPVRVCPLVAVPVNSSEDILTDSESQVPGDHTEL